MRLISSIEDILKHDINYEDIDLIGNEAKRERVTSAHKAILDYKDSVNDEKTQEAIDYFKDMAKSKRMNAQYNRKTPRRGNPREDLAKVNDKHALYYDLAVVKLSNIG